MSVELVLSSAYVIHLTAGHRRDKRDTVWRSRGHPSLPIIRIKCDLDPIVRFVGFFCTVGAVFKIHIWRYLPVILFTDWNGMYTVYPLVVSFARHDERSHESLLCVASLVATSGYKG